MPTIDTDAIAAALFDDPKVRTRIVRDYGLRETGATTESLTADLLHRFGQTPSTDPYSHSDSNIFRAAVRALASNSRSWRLVEPRLPQLEALLCGFDPVRVSQGTVSEDSLSKLLPGQTGSADARAMLRWARHLAENTSRYEDRLRALSRAFDTLAQDAHPQFTDSERMMCVAAFLSQPSMRWRGWPHLAPPDATPTKWKAPGMGYILACEFLRNLGWDGFKPDRHVKRLLRRWVPSEFQSAQVRALQLASLVGSRAKDLLDSIETSLVAVRISPPDVPLSHVDNLVWALGAYVEKAGHESTRTYIHNGLSI